MATKVLAEDAISQLELNCVECVGCGAEAAFFPTHRKLPSVYDSGRRVPCKETRGCELCARASWYVAYSMLDY